MTTTDTAQTARPVYVPSAATIAEAYQDRSEAAVASWQDTLEARNVLAKIAAQGEHFDCALFDELEAIRSDILNDAWCDFDGYESYWDSAVLPRAVTVEAAIDAVMVAA